jgi:hypothetical protein
MAGPVKADEFERAAAALDKSIIVSGIVTRRMQADHRRTLPGVVDSDAYTVNVKHVTVVAWHYEAGLCDI